MLPISSAFPVKGVQPVTWTIIGLCALVAMIQFVDTGPTADFTYMLYGAHPALVVFDFLPWNADSTSIAWTTVTSLFVHAGLLHVLGNMLFFHCFSLPIETLIGSARYALFYLVCGIVSVIVHSFFNPLSFEPLVGASGAVTGLLAAHTLLLPWTKIRIQGGLLDPKSIPAWSFTALWVALQFVQSLDENSNVAFGAHAGGALAGLMLAPLFVKPGVRLVARPVEEADRAREYDEGYLLPKPAAAGLALLLVAGLGGALFAVQSQADPRTAALAREWIAIARIDAVGVPFDEPGGLDTYRRAAAQNPDVATRLADKLRDGKVVPKDEAEAVKWYGSAADARQPRAMVAYALALIDGTAIARDCQRGAAMLLDLSQQNYSSADLQLGQILETGRGDTAIDLARAAGHYQRACENRAWERARMAGQAEACRRWAQMLKDGRGVPPDPDKAQKVLNEIEARRLLDWAAPRP